MFTYFSLIGAIALLVLAICFLDGDFDEGGRFATLLTLVKRPSARR